METSQFATALTETERNMRDRFVNEYLEDFDAVSALVRCGYAIQFAKDYAPRFMAEPYTLNRVKERQLEIGVQTDDDIHRRRIIAKLYREADNMASNGGSRVSALAQLSKILGIEAPVKTETNVNLKSTGIDLSHVPVAELERIKQTIYAKPIADSTVH